MVARRKRGRLGDPPALPLSHRSPITGTGTLHEGSVRLCPIRYRLSILRRFFRGTTGERQEATPAITGELRDLENACDLPDLFSRQALLTLELADGRLLDCVLQDAEGHVVAAGQGLRESPRKKRGRPPRA